MRCKDDVWYTIYLCYVQRVQVYKESIVNVLSIYAQNCLQNVIDMKYYNSDYRRFMFDICSKLPVRPNTPMNQIIKGRFRVGPFILMVLSNTVSPKQNSQYKCTSYFL